MKTPIIFKSLYVVCKHNTLRNVKRDNRGRGNTTNSSELYHKYVWYDFLHGIRKHANVLSHTTFSEGVHWHSRKVTVRSNGNSNYKECISDKFCGLFSENDIYTAPVYSWIKAGNCWPNQKSVVGCMLWKIIYSRREVRENQRVQNAFLHHCGSCDEEKNWKQIKGSCCWQNVQSMKRTA